MKITLTANNFYNNIQRPHKEYMQPPVSFGNNVDSFDKQDKSDPISAAESSTLIGECIGKAFQTMYDDRIVAMRKKVIQLSNARNKKFPDNRIDIETIINNIQDSSLYDDLEFLQNIIYLKNNSRQLIQENIEYLMDTDNIDYAARDNIVSAKLLYDVEGRKKQLHLRDVVELARSHDYILERIQKVNLLGKIEGRKSDLTIGDAISIARFDDEMCRQILEAGVLADIDGRENPLTGEEVINFHSFLLSHNNSKKSSKQSEDLIYMFHKAKERGLFSDKFGSDAYLNMSSAAELAKLTDQNFANIKNSGVLKFHPNLISETVEFLAYNSNRTQFLENAVTFFDLFDNTTCFDIQCVSDLNDEDFTNFVNITKEYNLNSKFSPEVCIAASKSGDEGMGEALNKVYDAAFLHRDQLGNANEVLSNFDIKNLVDFTPVVSAIYLLGANAFIHSFSMKYEGVCNLLKKLWFYEQIVQKSEKDELKEKLSAKSIPPEDKIQRLLTIISLEDIDARKILIDKICPNVPTKEMIGKAKAIWAEHGKTFDEKYETFCAAFDLDTENPKIKTFFESRATVNSKGYKILNNISSKDIAQLLAVEVVKPYNDAEWNKAVNNLVKQKFKLPDNDEFFKKVDFSKSKYLSALLSCSNDAKTNINSLFYQIQRFPDKTINVSLDVLPQNRLTRSLFKMNGLDYNIWTSPPDKEDEVHVKIKLDALAAKRAVISNIEKDLTDPLMDDLPKEETEKIFNALEEIGVTVKGYELPEYDGDELFETTTIVKNVTKKDKPVVFEDLPEIISTIKKVINENKFWTNPNENKKVDAARITIYNHLMKLRDTEIKNAKNLKSDIISDIHVRKADMNDVGYSLFLGNYASCCTAIGSSIGNDFAAPRYIMDKFISAIEILDDKTPIGNTMCYFANVDGKLALVLDNIELHTKYQYNDGIRDAIIKAAENICKSVGKPDLPIYAGPYRHKVDLSANEFKSRKIQIIGNTDGEDTYLDFAGTTPVEPEMAFNVELYKLK